ncbi:thioredoxin O1, mitochondrial-like isoform X2 [Lycium ferocissimum]|uniref:thioredoxin O1, mitochondrial-like isoform X2 n=1 Tax=Lycium ferocissimum TaxID=112874 RepID=UPI00281667CE|nr:thioredoxin O1, mitochondrial-like isoform X2 [Lycium ferocissimum]
MRGFSVILRRLIGCRPSISSGRRSSELGQTLMVSSAATVSYSTVTLFEKPNLLSGSPIAATLLPDLQSLQVLNHSRNFSAPSSSGRLLSPVIGQLSEKYPHVTTYKVDIDKEGLGNALSKLDIHSVPTLHFFQNGKKTSEVIGADVQRLKDTMEELYK